MIYFALVKNNLENIYFKVAAVHKTEAFSETFLRSKNEIIFFFIAVFSAGLGLHKPEHRQ